MRAVPNVLPIAGTDPTGGAGVQADLKAISATGGYGMSAITALVAQNTRGVRSVHYPPAAFLRAQLDAVADDVAIDAVKIGMLGTVEIIHAVADWLAEVRPPVVVLDPVMVATSGDRLLDADAEAALAELASRADVLTPNVPELAVLAGAAPASDFDGVLEQARRVAARTGALIAAKGGHLHDDEVRDALVGAAGVLTQVTHPRVATTSTHGTGCSLSSALATRYAVGGDWPRALAEATDWLAAAIGAAHELQVGGGHGPVHHFGPLWRRAGGALPARLVDDWWQRAAAVRRATLADPFVRGLGDGSVPLAAFRWYIAQDSLYLDTYAELLDAAARLATDPVEREFWRNCSTSAIETERALHGQWLPAGGDAAQPGPATTGYLDHLRAAEATGDYAVLSAALLPCFWVYAEVGDHLAALNRAGHPYGEWLGTYGDEAFAATTRQAVAITERAAQASGPVGRDAAETAFLRSCIDELDFFAAPLR
ncbi:bifunctional hydroxymethylpyrimidine kinase/phosphomethylpyrimidine kinase [Micropruina sonneratiae]|uniref:bifunctional hydroxymethylpyrimidine kinase/phosphomethylpyrimidine kinase n=1 Tax=Micropruina sonneratiae TaxID=2986940 RepID=UPI002226A327|nr:bifunctional hydroxymethylpyrimidine kinase/phosphomethylpyrimidine kinase [Micropruina sp. KQZ13P-5]MCW3159366.1 bifunctional hydroxymethylpyrimidine kinase/phosphomethylpyrimidine kinase [Micropruina sp. KQZ13P-5]